MSNLSLYEITNAFTTLIEKEELTDEEKKIIFEELTKLLQEKSQNIIGYLRNNDLLIKSIKLEEKRLANMKQVLENKQKRFKEYVKQCMENINAKKIETTLGTLTIAKSPVSVDIVDEDKIPSQYKTIVQTVKVNKKAITDNFKETGELIDGVKINTGNTNLRIK